MRHRDMRVVAPSTVLKDTSEAIVRSDRGLDAILAEERAATEQARGDRERAERNLGRAGR